MNRTYNFSAGPAMLPDEVLHKVQEELLNYHDIGCSIMEVGHRTNTFNQVVEKTDALMRELLNIPNDYHVLFLQGGAQGQFASIPLNLLGNNKRADYCLTGIWSQLAIAEAKRYGEINIVASNETTHGSSIPEPALWQLDANAAYLHYTPNETINGVEFHWIPNSGEVPLIADMSSTIMSRPIDVSKFGLIYAGAQKNLGPSGITLVIVRDDLLGKAHPYTPNVLNYTLQSQQHSLLNTPPTFAWYVVGLMLEWIKNQGGLAAMATHNQRKAQKLYHAIDSSDFYHNHVHPSCRSWMNIPFTLSDPSLDPVFLEQSQQAGLLALKGHRTVGGMRASLYNAMPEAGVDSLISFMAEFVRSYG